MSTQSKQDEINAIHIMANFNYDVFEQLENMFHLRTKFAKDLLKCEPESDMSLTIKHNINYINAEIVKHLGICELSPTSYEKGVQEDKYINSMYGIKPIFVKGDVLESMEQTKPIYLKWNIENSSDKPNCETEIKAFNELSTETECELKHRFMDLENSLNNKP